MFRTGRKPIALVLLTITAGGCAQTRQLVDRITPPGIRADRFETGGETGTAPGVQGSRELMLPEPPPESGVADPHQQVDFQQPVKSVESDSPSKRPSIVVATVDSSDAAGKPEIDSPETARAVVGGPTRSNPVNPPQSSSDRPAIAAIDPLGMNLDQMLAPIDVGEDERNDSSALTLEQLESIAMSGHPAVTAAQSRLSALRGRWVQAGLFPNPTAMYNGNEIGSGGVAGLHLFSIGQTYVTADKLQLQQSVIAARVRQAQADLEAAQARVRTDVRTAFVTALVAQRRLRLVRRLQEIANQSVESVQAMVSAQEVSRIELLQAQTESQQAELAVENAQSALDGARRRLAAVVASDAVADSPLKGDLYDQISRLRYAELKSETLVASPEVASRTAAIEEAQRALRLAFARVTPNINAQAGVGYDSGSDDTFASVQVTMPLPIHDRNQGNIRAARAEISRADSEWRRTQRSLQQRLADAFQRYQTARQRSERIENEIIPRAEETLDLSIQAFEAGEANYLQLLTVQRTLFQSRLDQLDATAQAARAAARIDGYLLSGSLAANNQSQPTSSQRQRNSRL